MVNPWDKPNRGSGYARYEPDAPKSPSVQQLAQQVPPSASQYKSPSRSPSRPRGSSGSSGGVPSAPSGYARYEPGAKQKPSVQDVAQQVPSNKPKSFTPSKFQQFTASKYQQAQRTSYEAEKIYQSIEPSSTYIAPTWLPGYKPGQTQTVEGWRLRQEYKKMFVDTSAEYQEQTRQQWQQSMEYAKVWHPDTKITEKKDKSGYSVSFPFSGAEIYGLYTKDKTPGTKELSGFFSPTDPLGLSSSFYAITGDKKKFEQKRMESYSYFYQGKQAWKQGKGLEHFGSYLVSSPIVQLGSIPAFAMTGGAGYSYVAGRLAFKSISLGGKAIAASSLFKTGVAIGGTALATPSLLGIKKDVEMRRPGDAFAKSYMLGASVVIGAKSFRMCVVLILINLFRVCILHLLLKNNGLVQVNLLLNKLVFSVNNQVMFLM